MPDVFKNQLTTALRRSRKPATRALSTAHADVFVDDEDLQRYATLPTFLPTLARTFEERVQPAVWGAFGAPTDVDQNGKILVLITHELGEHLKGGWLIGYFGNGDLLREREALTPTRRAERSETVPPLQGERGDAVAVTFVYTRCRDECPIITRKFGAVRALLADGRYAPWTANSHLAARRAQGVLAPATSPPKIQRAASWSWCAARVCRAGDSYSRAKCGRC